MLWNNVRKTNPRKFRSQPPWRQAIATDCIDRLLTVTKGSKRPIALKKSVFPKHSNIDG